MTIRQALTRDQITAIVGRLDAVEAPGQLLPVAVRAVSDALLAHDGPSAHPLPAGQQLHLRGFAIPARQWEAITAAVTSRAAAWGIAVELALELINVLPGTYEDPDAPIPDLPRPDHRPDQLQVQLSRDAVDVIAAVRHHLQTLASYYGPQSAQHLAAATSWLSCLSQVLTMTFGPSVRVVRDGTLSLLMHTSSGFTFAAIFHGDARRCTAGDGCTALIADDGTAHAPFTTAAVADHQHRPSFALDAPRPGTWSLHS
ncbi:hypothetical protein ACIA5C_47860 [Actinoplanes sp. NPDC051343]|uniref:hypothetical protein n=1 Tax=Actinoplanes sp. NPDC051343 TaxID=3363906 RepID=UPI0037B6236A